MNELLEASARSARVLVVSGLKVILLKRGPQRLAGLVVRFVDVDSLYDGVPGSQAD